LFSLAVLEKENEKIAEAIVSAIRNAPVSKEASILISHSDHDEFLETSADIDLLVISPNAHLSGKSALKAKCILLPGTLLESLCCVASEYVITYGMSPRDTLTISSINEEEVVISMQRELVTLFGEILERQDLPKIPLQQSSPEKILSVTGALLSIGIPFESIRIPE
jgi:hypothetical protein